MFSEHASGEDKGENGRAEHDGRAVAQGHVLDGVEHAEKKESSEHALHHSSDANTDRTEKHLGGSCSGPPALVDTYGKHEDELKNQNQSLVLLINR